MRRAIDDSVVSGVQDSTGQPVGYPPPSPTSGDNMKQLFRTTVLLTVAVSIGLPVLPGWADSEPLWTQVETTVDPEQSFFGVEFDDLALNERNGTVFVQGTTATGSDIAGYTAAGARLGTRPSVGNDPVNDALVGSGLDIDSAAGTLFSLAGDYSDGTDEIVLTAYGEAGPALWTSRYSGPGGGGAAPVDVAVDSQRRVVYVAGFTTGATSVPVLLAYAYDGTLLRERRGTSPSPSSSVRATSLAIDPDSGRVFVAGTITGTGGSSRIVVYGYSPGGRLLWTATPPGGAEAIDLAVDEQTGTVVVTGQAGPGVRGDALTVAFTSDGQLQWQSRYGGDGAQVPAALAVDPVTSDVYVSGFQAPLGQRADTFTLAYAADGQQRWVRSFDGVGGGDAAQDVAVDGRRGIVYATGFSDLKPADNVPYEFLLLAYDRDGQVLDTTIFDEPRSRRSDAAAVVVEERSGRVVISGTSLGEQGYGPGSLRTVAYPSAA